MDEPEVKVLDKDEVAEWISISTYLERHMDRLIPMCVGQCYRFRLGSALDLRPHITQQPENNHGTRVLRAPGCPDQGELPIDRHRSAEFVPFAAGSTAKRRNRPPGGVAVGSGEHVYRSATPTSLRGTS